MINQNTFWGIKLVVVLLFALMSKFLNAQTYEQVCLEYIVQNKDQFKNIYDSYLPTTKVEFYYYPVVQDLKFFWEGYSHIDTAKLLPWKKDILEFYKIHESLYKDTVYIYHQSKYNNKLKLKPVKGAKASTIDITNLLEDGKKGTIISLVYIYSKIEINGFIYVLADIEFGYSDINVLFKINPLNKQITGKHVMSGVN